MAKKSSDSREGDFYRAQLSQDLVPLIHTNMLFSAGYGREDLPEAVFLMWGERQLYVDGVYHLSQ